MRKVAVMGNVFLSVLRWVFLVFAGLYTLHFALIAAGGLIKPFAKHPDAQPYHHIAVLIPVRNEEHVIGNLLDSICKAHYPHDLLDVYVLINNTTDKTGQIARSYGASIIDYGNTVHSKGDVLGRAFAALTKQGNIDAFAIFDADNLVDPDFFTAMNSALNHGVQVAQGRRLGKNTHDTFLSGFYEVFYQMQNVLFNNGAQHNRRSAVLNGTGWMISSDVLQKHPFDTVTITEDLELSAQCALWDIPVTYVHDARCYDEYPMSAKMSLRQLFRWIFGQVQCMRCYTGKLLKKWIRTHSVAAQDLAMVFAMPGAVIIGGVGLVLTFITLPWRKALLVMCILLIILYLAFDTLLQCCLHKAEIHGCTVQGLLFPVFMCIWVPLMIVCLFKKNVAWKPIEHNRAAKIEDMKQ